MSECDGPSARSVEVLAAPRRLGGARAAEGRGLAVAVVLRDPGLASLAAAVPTACWGTGAGLRVVAPTAVAGALQAAPSAARRRLSWLRRPRGPTCGPVGRGPAPLWEIGILTASLVRVIPTKLAAIGRVRRLTAVVRHCGGSGRGAGLAVGVPRAAVARPSGAQVAGGGSAPGAVAFAAAVPAW